MYNWSTLKKLIWLYAAKLKGGAQAIIETITGTLPLVLQNAINHSIKSLTRYGLCTQDGTPTPSAPVDIVCNNGALRFGALGVNLLNPVGIVIGQNYTPEGNTSSSQNNWRTGFIPIEGGKTYAFWGRKKSDNTMSAFNRINWFDADGNNILPRPDYNSYAVTVGIAPSNAAFVGLSCSCYNSSAAITQETLDEFNWMLAETDIEIPYEPFVGGIVADGTPEVLTVSGPNLLNPATNITGKYIDSWGNESPGSDAQYTDLIPVNEGETYVCSLVSGRNSGKDRLHGYNANGRWVKQIVFVDAAGQQGNKLSMVATIDSGISYVRLSYGIDDTEAMIEKGSTTTDYQPYVPPQTASVPMLLSVGDYADEAEIISGGVMRKVGVKVLDGTEAWTLNGTMRYVLTISDMATLSGRTEGMCTHFSYAGSSANAGTYFLTSTRRLFVHTGVETVDDFKAWLASEYANGTPVIVVYPLATATTEQTTAQHLSTYQGTNIVDSVANVGPLEAKVEYYTSA